MVSYIKYFLNRSLKNKINIFSIFVLVISIFAFTIVSHSYAKHDNSINLLMGNVQNILSIIMPLLGIMIFTILNYSFFSFSKKLSSDDISLFTIKKSKYTQSFSLQFSLVIFLFIYSIFIFLLTTLISSIFEFNRNSFVFGASFAFGFFFISLILFLLIQFISLFLKWIYTIVLFLIINLSIVFLGLFVQGKISEGIFQTSHSWKINPKIVEYPNAAHKENFLQKRKYFFSDQNGKYLESLNIYREGINSYTEKIDPLYGISSIFNIFNKPKPNNINLPHPFDGYRWSKNKYTPILRKIEVKEDEINPILKNDKILKEIDNWFNNTNGIIYNAPDIYKYELTVLILKPNLPSSWPKTLSDFLNMNEVDKHYVIQKFLYSGVKANNSDGYNELVKKNIDIDIFRNFMYELSSGKVEVSSQEDINDRKITKYISIKDIMDEFNNSKTVDDVKDKIKSDLEIKLNTSSYSGPIPKYYFTPKVKSSPIKWIVYLSLITGLFVMYPLIISKKDFK